MKLRKTIPLFFVAGLINLSLSTCSTLAPTTLKDAYSGKFLIGAAINKNIVSGNDEASMEILKREFNSITAENCMKSAFLQPENGVFYFDEADRFVQFGEENGMAIIGHCLLWHSQAPKWFFTDEKGQDVSRDELIQRMQDHITTVVSRYKGRIKGWDVVNEAILDDGSWRDTKFYRIIGEDFVKLAFLFAHEADPDCELYYNDYSMMHEGRRNGVVEMVQNLQAQGVKVDGIGMQGHYGLEYPDFAEFEKSLVAFAGLGCKIHITELDFTVLPSPDPHVGADVAASFEYQQSLNPYSERLPDEVVTQQYSQYTNLFSILLKHVDCVERVTLWGISDADSWKNNWPIRGRTDYPLLFDREYQAKPVVKDLIKLALN